MRYHVLTPFSRFQNLIELGNHLKDQGVEWHLLLDQNVNLPDLGRWIHQYHFPPPPDGFFIGHWMINQFLDNTQIIDEDRYVVLTDDDFTEPGFFRKLDQYDDDVLIVSMKRSNTPTGGDGEGAFDTLMAKPENIRVGSVGFEQMVIKGKVLRQYRCEGDYQADGLLIMKIYEDRMDHFRFVPDASVYFNYLPPGRWGRWDQ